MRKQCSDDETEVKSDWVQSPRTEECIGNYEKMINYQARVESLLRMLSELAAGHLVELSPLFYVW